ncbi:hypothetical protein C370_07405, partial [Cryptococcus neoformans A1-35-8]
MPCGLIDCSALCGDSGSIFTVNLTALPPPNVLVPTPFPAPLFTTPIPISQPQNLVISTSMRPLTFLVLLPFAFATPHATPSFTIPSPTATATPSLGPTTPLSNPTYHQLNERCTSGSCGGPGGESTLEASTITSTIVSTTSVPCYITTFVTDSTTSTSTVYSTSTITSTETKEGTVYII